MVDRFHCPKYTIKESNLPEVDVFVQTHSHQFTCWDQLVMTPQVRIFNENTPAFKSKYWNVLDRNLPMHVYNSTGVIHYQTPLEMWPTCGSTSSY